MNAYCPECETDLDLTTGICPACRWDPLLARASAVAQDAESEMSLTERYRGTQYAMSMEQAVMEQREGVSRARAFVLLSLVGAVALYGAIMSATGAL